MARVSAYLLRLLAVLMLSVAAVACNTGGGAQETESPIESVDAGGGSGGDEEGED